MRRLRRRSRPPLRLRPPVLSGVLAELVLLVLFSRVQRLARQLLAPGGEQLDFEQVVAIVVGRDQRETLLVELALIDGEAGQLGGHDRPAGDQRPPPDQRHRGDRPVVPAPGADHLIAEVELPIGIARGRLLGEVHLRGEVARVAALGRGDEAECPNSS